MLAARIRLRQKEGHMVHFPPNVKRSEPNILQTELGAVILEALYIKPCLH
jgi:hypothetical protein